MIRFLSTILLALLALAPARAADFQIPFPDADVFLLRDLDSSNSAMTTAERIAIITRAARAGAIHSIDFPTATVTTGQDVTVSLQDIDSSGNPDGTPDQSGTVTVASSDDNVWKSVTFGADRTVAAGEIFAVVIDWTSTAGDMQIRATAGLSGEASYFARYSGSWARVSRGPELVIHYADGVIANGYGLLGAGTSNTSFGTGSSPDEIVNLFQLPAGGRALGAKFRGRIESAEIVLYNAAGTVLATAYIAEGAFNSATTFTSMFYVPFLTTKPTLSADTNYRLVLKPTSADTARLYAFDFISSAARAGFPDGARIQRTSRTDAGSWTETDTSISALSLVLDTIETGGGGSGARRNRIQGHGF